MQRNDNSIIWNPGELIYEIGNIPEEAYLILEGYVIIETKDKFQLNSCLLYTSPSPRDGLL